ncbi:MAG: 1,4-dihydroxy-2-naphthoate polyprenyltransferase [Alphaproteobacteria bacterium]|nr:MAG: 1,4-dihydroxy-2-naphthoate polyprenyltransferase [Alphaproteobacteria bacterium]
MINNWLMAIRPKTLFASIAPVILGLAIAYVHQSYLNISVAILTLVATLLMQIASNLANDYLDSLKGVDTDKRLGPTRVTHTGLISADSMKKALISVMALAFLTGIYLMFIGGPVIILVGLMSLYFAYGYTGGPFPLSHNGLGEVAALLFFGIIAVTGTTYLQTHQFSKLAFIMSFGPGFISATILAINNLRDIETDRESHKKTIAVRFGERFQRRLCLFLIGCSSIVILIVTFVFGYTWIFPVFFLPLAFMGNWLHIAQKPIDKKMNNALAKTAQYLLFYCVLTSIGLLLSTGTFW